MGGCCFTPTKKDFLWWYWLLLASIVGIPMLLAVLYVAWLPGADDETKKRRGKTAAWIFWVGTFLVAMAAFAVAKALLLAIYPYPEPANAFSYWDWNGHHYSEGFGFLALHFFCATVAANGADSLAKKQKGYVRILLVVLCLASYLLVLSFLDNGILMHRFDIRRPAINVMQFLACMFPALLGQLQGHIRFQPRPESPRGISRRRYAYSSSCRTLARISSSGSAAHPVEENRVTTIASQPKETVQSEALYAKVASRMTPYLNGPFWPKGV